MQGANRSIVWGNRCAFKRETDVEVASLVYKDEIWKELPDAISGIRKSPNPNS